MATTGNSESEITRRLLENKRSHKLEEASFDLSGKHFSAAFGRYSADGKKISAGDYAKARELYNKQGNPSSVKSKTSSSSPSISKTPASNRELTNSQRQFLEDMAQESGGFTYKDINNLSNNLKLVDEDTHKALKKAIIKVKKDLKETGLDAYDSAMAYDDIKDDIENLKGIVKDISSHNTNNTRSTTTKSSGSWSKNWSDGMHGEPAGLDYVYKDYVGTINKENNKFIVSFWDNKESDDLVIKGYTGKKFNTEDEAKKAVEKALRKDTNNTRSTTTKSSGNGDGSKEDSGKNSWEYMEKLESMKKNASPQERARYERMQRDLVKEKGKEMLSSGNGV